VQPGPAPAEPAAAVPSARPGVASTTEAPTAPAAAAAQVRGYDPSQPLSGTNHPYLVFADDPDPRVASVVEAIRTGAHPERLNADVAPAPFDPVAFAADPQEYINEVVPGRALQVTFDPAAGVLTPLGRTHRATTVGASTRLQVQAEPGVPVSWFSPEGGLFVESRLNALTTLADAQGVAEVTWYAAPGVINEAIVIAGSPLLRHQVVFHLWVEPGGSATAETARAPAR